MKQANPRPLGVSIIICCHNAESRLRTTLEHLQQQQFNAELSWEVLVVDNASTDRTMALAREIWDENPVTNLRVVEESELGLSQARLKGFAEARYTYWALVDDDNWLALNWVQTLYDFMNATPRAGICGGYNEAVFELPPGPQGYFPRDLLAIGKPTSASDKEKNQRLEIRKGSPPGAGLGIRAEAWEQLQARGFKFVSTDRQGKSLSSGGDIEISLALDFMGWEIWYVPGLQLKHLMPEGRTKLEYLHRLALGIGHGLAFLDAYHYTGEIQEGKVRLESPKLHWTWRLVADVKRALSQGLKLRKLPASQRKQGRDYLEFLITIGRIRGLWNLKGRYRENIRWISELFLNGKA